MGSGGYVWKMGSSVDLRRGLSILSLGAVRKLLRSVRGLDDEKSPQSATAMTALGSTQMLHARFFGQLDYAKHNFQAGSAGYVP